MDLPPSSYHDSLEELWDEEEEPEEIETVMKMVTSAYHQYLDVFSKVKAEELPPHRPCDHHIELEGSLPAEALRQFNQLKEALTTAPILSHINPSLPTIVETYASDFALGAVLSQAGISRAGEPFPFLFLALVKLSPIIIHFNISCHQACWAGFLPEFHFSIAYGPGGLATLLDALSHWDNAYPERGEDFIRKNTMNYQKIIKQDEIQASELFSVKVNSFSNLIVSNQKELWQDSQYRSISQDLGKGKSVQYYSLDSSYQRFFFKGLVVVPNDTTIQLNILKKRHYSPLAGHPVQDKTLKLVKRDFHWSGMTQFSKDYVSSCQKCPRNKNVNHKKFGLLKPLSNPNGPWICISMDFITQLPMSSSFDSILVIVEIFSKMAVFIPTMSSITSMDLAPLLIENIFSKHGLPSSIVSDRGSLFLFFLDQSLSAAQDFKRSVSLLSSRN
ncbi:hypothetical protein O181_105875 [Austropuccinia psidii MF-1]|uniref:Integrase catalytic domain-containing protein n=1 Tax=Austropuccinia psidii MF-1 TaxID=1389203 RepID=A0A9Q3JMI9_9BASI|nr:hypothetical protein [Austropuccinia psidii MF-1]